MQCLLTSSSRAARGPGIDSQWPAISGVSKSNYVGLRCPKASKCIYCLGYVPDSVGTGFELSVFALFVSLPALALLEFLGVTFGFPHHHHHH